MPPLIRNIASTYAVRLATLAAGVALFPIVAEGVGLARYGIWLLISGSIGLFFAADLGMGAATLREVARAHAHGNRDELGQIVSSSLAFFGGLGSLLCAAWLGTMALLWPTFGIAASDHRLAVAMLVIAGLSTFLAGFPLGIFSTVLMGIQRADVANAIQLALVVTRFGAIVALLQLGYGILAVVIADAALGLLAGFAALVACGRLLPGVRIAPGLIEQDRLRAMAPFGLQVFAVSASGLVILQTDTLVVGAFLPVAMVAIYSGAYRPYLVCRQLAYALVNPLAPDAARASAMAATDRLRDLLVRGTRYANALVLLVAVPGIVFAEPVLEAWAGREVADEARVTQVLLGSLLVNASHLVAYALLVGMGRIGAFLRYHLVWAAANLVLGLVLVQPLGLVGVALGTAIPVVLLEPLYLRVALREIGVTAREFLEWGIARPFLAAIPAAALLALVAWRLPDPTLPGVIAFSAAYAALVAGTFVAIATDDTDRGILRRLVRRVVMARA